MSPGMYDAMADLELKKIVPAIWMKGVQPIHRRFWNVLAFHAFPYLSLDREEYRAPVSEAVSTMKLETRNYEYIRAVLSELMTRKVEWDVLDTQGAAMNLKGATMISHYDISRGMITWGYAKPLRELMLDPEMYAIISLTLQNDFKYDYSAVLYEMAVQLYSFKDGRSYGSWMPLDLFREMVGIEVDAYPRFADFRRYVVERTTNEIRERTPFIVEVEYEARLGRAIDHIKLNVVAKTQVEKPLPPPDSPTMQRQRDYEALRADYAALPAAAKQSIADLAKQRLRQYLYHNRRTLRPAWEAFREHGVMCAEVASHWDRILIEVFAEQRKRGVQLSIPS